MSKTYIIGSGWWCTEVDNREARFLNGDDAIRGKAFHNVWAEAVSKFTNPLAVFIVDSKSPIKAEWRHDLLPIQVCELPVNLGHASSIKTGKFCGWTASVLLSMQYAALSHADFYVYVEQDVLVYGKGLIEAAIESMGDDVDYLFGKSENSTQPLQQSFFIIRKSGIDQFVSNMNAIKYSDAQISPEVKFALSTSYFFNWLPKFVFRQYPGTKLGKIVRRVVVALSKIIGRYQYVPYGFGRSRPIDFNSQNFYFQHGDQQELKSYIEKMNAGSTV